MSNNMISLVPSVSILKDGKRVPRPQLLNLWAVTYLYVEFLDLCMKTFQAKAHFVMGVHSFICSLLLRMLNAFSLSTEFWRNHVWALQSCSTKSKLGATSVLTTLLHLELYSGPVWQSEGQLTCGSHHRLLLTTCVSHLGKVESTEKTQPQSERWDSDFQVNFKWAISVLFSLKASSAFTAVHLWGSLWVTLCGGFRVLYTWWVIHPYRIYR